MVDFTTVVSREFLHLSLVARFGLGKMGSEFLDLCLVARVRLRKELAVEIFDLGYPIWNKSV